MFIGHYAVALAGKSTSPRVSLGTLLLSAQLSDLLWPIFILFGLEHLNISNGATTISIIDFFDYRTSHGFLGTIIWSILLGSRYYIFRRELRGAITISVCVMSHWILDLINQRAELIIGFNNNVYLGFGFWNSIPGTLIMEITLYLIGILMYVRATSARDKIGKYGFWLLIIILFELFLINIFKPLPISNETTIVLAAIASWFFIFWAYWIDRHRQIPNI